MIDLYFWPTGNGLKVAILLEELGLPYTVRPINIRTGEQKQDWFQAISANGSFNHARIKTVTIKIIHPVHIQLTGNHLVKKLSRIHSLKHLDGNIQPSFHLPVQLLHHRQRDRFVMYTWQQHTFEHM